MYFFQAGPASVLPARSMHKIVMNAVQLAAQRPRFILVNLCVLYKLCAQKVIVPLWFLMVDRFLCAAL